jgi:hypothetical protein
MGRARWGWYIAVFKRLAQGEQMNFAMSPVEYLRCWEEQPRLMAILEIVQGRFVQKTAERQEESLKEARGKHGNVNRQPSHQSNVRRSSFGHS